MLQQHFPNEDMRADHVDGYCVCKCLIKFPLAMHFDGKVKPTARRRIMPPKEAEEDSGGSSVQLGSADEKVGSQTRDSKETRDTVDKSESLEKMKVKMDEKSPYIRTLGIWKFD